MSVEGYHGVASDYRHEEGIVCGVGRNVEAWVSLYSFSITEQIEWDLILFISLLLESVHIQLWAG